MEIELQEIAKRHHYLFTTHMSAALREAFNLGKKEAYTEALLLVSTRTDGMERLERLAGEE